MHLPDGLLSLPVCLGAGALAAGLVGLALVRTRPGLPAPVTPAPLIGVTAAFIFAAQMINYPVGPGVSGHVLGAALAALLLGPFEAGLVLTLVIALQCLLFADGGLLALGANVLNMGFVAGGAGWLTLHGLGWLLPRRLRASRPVFLALAAVAGWVSVVASALACSAELALSHTAEISAGLIFGLMTSVHAVIGLGEALLTWAVLSAVLSARPEWVRAWPGDGTAGTSEPAPLAEGAP